MPSNTPNFNTAIPEKIMTPDRVSTRLGALEFFDGMPTDATASTLLDHLTLVRGVEVFLNTVQVASLEAVRTGLAEVGATAANKVVIYDDLMDSNSLFLTGNTDTVYALAMLELDRDGPTVVEVPPGCGPGTVDDAWFRFVVDMGAPGPDRGRGGKYLIVPPGYEGTVPDGLLCRPIDQLCQSDLVSAGSSSTAVPSRHRRCSVTGSRSIRSSRQDDPPAMEFINRSGKVFNTIHANTFEFYEELHRVIDSEPVEIIDPETRGLIAGIGIRKGKHFKPDERIREILVDAAAVGNATARTLFFQTNVADNFLYEGSYWKRGFFGGDYRFLLDGEGGERNLDARTSLFYMATLNTPAMTMKMIGAGSQYAWGDRDSSGHYLDGSKSYRLTLPPNVPAKNFWSVVAYDPQTRSELQTGQPYPSRSSQTGDLAANPDGSIDLYFGPESPEGFESNWVQTVPGKGWFTLLRLYGPLEPWFDQTWRPGNSG